MDRVAGGKNVEDDTAVTKKHHDIDGYNQAVGPCRFVLRLLGAWPDPYHDSAWADVKLTFIVLIMFIFATLSQSVKMFRSIKNFNVVTEIFVNCDIPTTIATVKIVTIWYHRSVFKSLLRTIIEDWKEPRNDAEITLMLASAKRGKIITVTYLFLNEGTLITSAVANLLEPISFALKSHVNDTEQEERPLYFMGSFPYDPQLSPNYEFSVLGQLLSNIFASLSFSSSDSLFFVLVYHLLGQLSILQLAIQDLPNRANEAANCEDYFLKKLSFIHTEHLRLWRFSKNLEDCFNVMFLIQIIPCMCVLCIQGYLLIMLTEAEKVPVMDTIFIVYFFLLFLFTIFTYCYMAEILRQKSTEIGYATYNCDWTVLPSKQAKLLILISIRGQRPFELTAGKFVIFSLELYCRILKTSAGYLSMLLAVKDRMLDQSDESNALSVNHR